ncbi:hypothetical protein PENTCL1PPCAC_15890, partial [Pristionchus entomophagus]
TVAKTAVAPKTTIKVEPKEATAKPKVQQQRPTAAAALQATLHRPDPRLNRPVPPAHILKLTELISPQTLASAKDRFAVIDAIDARNAALYRGDWAKVEHYDKLKQQGCATAAAASV